MANTGERGISPDILISPEKIQGSEFRVPSVIGYGEGEAYTFDGMHVPIGWQDNADILPLIPKSENFKKLFAIHAQSQFVTPGRLDFDPKSHLLTRVSVISQGEEQSAQFSSDPDKQGQGMYELHDVRDLNSALVLQAIIAKYLSYVQPDEELGMRYAFIQNNGGWYMSDGLILPRSLHVPMNADEQSSFSHRAAEIAAGFNHTIWPLSFRNGMLYSSQVVDGDRCTYTLTDGLGGPSYIPHNVDHGRQAATLHGITAAYINNRMENQTAS